MSYNDVSIVIVGRNDYKMHFGGMSKNERIYRMKNADLSEKSRQL